MSCIYVTKPYCQCAYFILKYAYIVKFTSSNVQLKTQPCAQVYEIRGGELTLLGVPPPNQCVFVTHYKKSSLRDEILHSKFLGIQILSHVLQYMYPDFSLHCG